MAHLAGVSTSPSNFMVAIYDFALLNGWTDVRNNGATSAGFATGHGTSTAQHSFYDPNAVLPGVERAQINMICHDTPATQAVIRFCPSTGDSGALAEFWEHTGSPSTTGAASETTQMGHFSNATPLDLGFGGSHVGYHLYTAANPDGSLYLHGWVEGTTGTFFHFAVGTFVKSGAYDGGQYCDASFLNYLGGTNARSPFKYYNHGGSNTSPWTRMDEAFADGHSFTGGWQELNGWAFSPGGTLSNQRSLLSGFYYGGANGYNLRNPLSPIYQPFARSNGSQNSGLPFGAWKPMGHVQDMRLVSMKDLSARDTITLGTDVWDIIPAFRKGAELGSSAYSQTGTQQDQTSNQMGYAYRRV